MSTCPHRLLLSCLRARSLSRFAGRRLRTRLHHQQSRPIGTRHLSENASQSDIEVLAEDYDDLRVSAQLHGFDSEAPTSNTPATVEDNVTEAFTDIDGEFGGAIAGLAANRTINPQSAHASTSGSNPLQNVGEIFYNYSLKGRKLARKRIVSRALLEQEALVRWNSLYSGQAAVDRWRSSCAEISSKAESHENNLQPDQITLELNEQDNVLLEKLKLDDKQDFCKAWGELCKSEKIGHWHRLSLWLLYHSPALVPDFLRITCQNPEKPVFVKVSDCIAYLLRFSPDLVDEPLITDCLHPDTWPILFLTQWTVRLYVSKANSDAVYYAWDRARKRKVHLEITSLLCFMKRFTDLGDVDRALEVIQRIQTMSRPPLNLNSERVIRQCCKLLTLDSVVYDGNVRNFRILPKLLKLGVRPTLDMMNVVLSNAFKTGDLQVGHSVLNYMKEQGMEYDSFTYLTLLSNAVRTRDSEGLDALLREIQAKEKLHGNPWILSKILHSHFINTIKEGDLNGDPKSVFYSMLAIYDRVHDITPLKELSIVPHHYTSRAGVNGSPPSPVALYIMIATYLRCMKGIENVEHVYSRFRHFVFQGNKTISPLAETEHTYNEFLVAFRRDPRGLRPAVRLVEDMLGAATEDGSTKKFSNTANKHVYPGSLTWSILMSCFVFNKQPLAVEKVRAMMSKHGIQYDINTWNMIVNNYANAQNVSALARTIKEMEMAGVAPNNYTLNPLRFLRDPERLWAAVDELDRASNQGFVAEPHGQEDVEEENSALLDDGLQRLKDNAKAKT
ncbi:hypothetical protein BDW62DRAFT_190905 [Aspergillus aurantiobrunneus]